MKATYVDTLPSKRECRKGRKQMMHKVIEHIDRFANSDAEILKIDPEHDYVSVVSLYNSIRRILIQSKRDMVAYVRGNSVYVVKF